METVKNGDIVVIKSANYDQFSYSHLVGTICKCTWPPNFDWDYAKKNLITILEDNRWCVNFCLKDLRPATTEEIEAYNKNGGPVRVSEVDYTPVIDLLDQALDKLTDKLKGGKDV
jgi:hypothetical protein